MKIPTTFATCAVIVTTFTGAFALAYPAPVDCKIQVLHHVSTAMERDRGTARENTRVAKNASRKLTDAEIKEILDRVYILMKSEKPSDIGKAIYADCPKGH